MRNLKDESRRIMAAAEKNLEPQQEEFGMLEKITYLASSLFSFSQNSSRSLIFISVCGLIGLYTDPTTVGAE